MHIPNYKSIWIIPHLVKLLESLVYSTIKRSFNHIITDDQHGFRLGNSKVTSMILFTSYILDNLKKIIKLMLILLIFKKTIDSVDHGLLILDSLGVGVPLLFWLKSYLTSRLQFVALLLLKFIFNFFWCSPRKTY